ncbi:serine/threonine-protein phosphatase 1 regulatory subunit 10-like isoform X3 [Zootermopsis nevadensis]|uniref:serine/threonine-protein phosphatase 1 regulatory subunit 10-like isoform X3 n=1 Tax=Zootermopsis nevadensis TaxID=136037 RepID=UPI000B8E905B|nr:serine/threonine-protein phosphatase 1 regulatory subunit 10-like isoform X3 [Zootermopsis nevadensis]XP_021939927.1 serine/threonine-protein phosphatase 1 regulatory subunit 10-like isoform X3 [Zootermopsis nevadensis]XP_021939928.1 serine/threonine-protein phosphatase 1 regulatory subunit 10-like isoform X3 [Zootermopsis nevadensis]
MPRIDPLQLLKCLSVLLSPAGGIKSKEEVQRLASLMTKFSKKLVSKCIYIQILKTTKTDLLGMFMAAGGWNLTHTWLSDAIVAKNWPLIQELLELLLMCPVDVERLKTNNCPKLIKGLSKESTNESVKLLASKLVEQWLKIVKGETEAVRAHQIAGVENKAIEVVRTENKTPEATCVSVTEDVNRTELCSERLQTNSCSEECKVDVTPPPIKQESVVQVKAETLGSDIDVHKLLIKTEDASDDSGEDVAWDAPLGQLPVYKITIRDGKRVLAKVYSGEKANRRFSVDSCSSVASFAEEGKSVKISSGVMKINDPVAAKKEELKKETEETPVKVSIEPQKVPMVKLKVKSEKLENNVEGTNLTKDIQKKPKDAQSSSKMSDKLRRTKVESSKEKSREKIPSKDRNKEKSKDKESNKETSKVKDKKQSNEKICLNSEKDRAAIAKLIPPAISKLGKIPKKPRPEEPQSSVSDIKKPSSSDIKKPPVPESTSRKPSISIESRKPSDSARPKTVKTFNSKFRSTGLEEEAKPPPSRLVKKTTTPVDKKPVKLPSLKRSSPPNELSTPPEKKLKPMIADTGTDDAKKSVGIKLIPPRPKPSFLQESDMFMDALTASTKKEPRKRKRRTSSSKDGPDTKKEAATGKEEETIKESTPPSSPTNNGEDSKSPPIVRPLLKFYQDTLETNDDEKGDDGVKENEKKTDKSASVLKGKSEEEDQNSPTPSSQDGNEGSPEDAAYGTGEGRRRLSKDDSPKEDDGYYDEGKGKDSTENAPGKYPKGVLIYHKTKKGPKKVVRWKQEKDLETIKYFELDETERVNVTKTFMDMKQMERSNEREAFLHARKLPQDDTMEEKISWQPLIPIDMPPSLVEPGIHSREKDVQYAREKVILQALYFSRAMIPDSASEPDQEIHPTTDPVIIPLDDVTGNPDSVNDYQNTPWPEPKPLIIPQSPPPQFQQSQPPSFGSFSNQTFPGPPQIFPNQSGIPNNMPMPGSMMGPNPVNNMNPMSGMNNMGPGGGDWRTGDGKVLPINEMPLQIDMYNQGGPPMGIGMPSIPAMGGMGGPGPEINYNMMGGEDIGPYGPQGFAMGGPHPGMYPFRGGRGPNMSGGIRSGRGGNQMGPRGPNGGPWYRPNGPHPMGNSWQGGGGGGRGGRGWGGQNRGICKHFRGGFCRNADTCPYLHPGVNGPQY